MATRTAGRHRSTKNLSPPPPPPSLLLLDYLESGQLPGRQFTGAPGGARGYQGGTTVFRPSANRRRLALSVLAGVAVAAVLGGYVLLRSPGTGGRNAVPRLTPPPVSMLPSAGGSARPATPKPAPSRARHRAAPHRTASTPQVATVAPPATPAPGAASPARPRSPAIVARYRIASQGPAGFQGEVAVTNNGTQAISDWRIVIALPYDQVFSFSNASGFFSNGILLLSPGPGGNPVRPGGTLRVFFVAEGTQTVPEACAFNQTICS